MTKRVFHYFFDFLDGQERWLNKMAAQGLRLKKCGKIAYVFEECSPDKYAYTVELLGDKSFAKAKEYQTYLESMGFRTFTKNFNLNYSFGKLKWSPFAKGAGQIRTSPGNYNKELLILEKKQDGKPFELHTALKDKLIAYRSIRRVYLYGVLMLLLLLAITFIQQASSLTSNLLWSLRVIITSLSILYLLPAHHYSSLVKKLKDESRIYE